MSGRDDPEGSGPEPRPEGGAGAGGEAADALPADMPDPGNEPDADVDTGGDAEAEPPMEAPSPGVPVSPEEYRRLKEQAAEMPEDS